ncbi:hypothetical protein NESM_000254000 [Novymonas esmeraldas]|uniref:Sperm protein n=1 Tax=Novymonas esmeraldas TaxID=1808958 RepID=A0AAW0FA20_9TRYP
MRSPLLATAATVAAVLCVSAVLPSAITPARAVGPITVEQCSIINPRPIVTACTAYLPPIIDVYGVLPYDTVSSYSQCVKERCVCTGAATSLDITTEGIYCNSTGWMESGFTTCNRFNYCFVNFWRCMNRALFTRYISRLPDFTTVETNIVTDIIAHGNHPGEPFDLTDVYRSCRLMMCAAANSRQNCGLVTCLPNYTQCDEYIRPPPLPYTHQLCTQGCRAVLLMMALTIAVVSFSMCCFCCCPAQVRISEPIIKEDAAAKKLESNSISNEPHAQDSLEQQQQPAQEPERAPFQ